jgi:hypothetical protein
MNGMFPIEKEARWTINIVGGGNEFEMNGYERSTDDL